MKLLNRSGLSVVPKLPFIEWAAKQQEDPLNQVLTAAEQQQEGTLYLIAEVESEADFEAAIEQHWQAIFENELAAWDEFGDDWPQGRDRALFEQWFSVVPQVASFDLRSEPLMTATL